jgi:hypothetical protein
MPDHPGVFQILNRLNHGQSEPVAALIESAIHIEGAPAISQDSLLEMIKHFVHCGAILLC